MGRTANLQEKKGSRFRAERLDQASGQHDTANFIFISRDEKICFNQGGRWSVYYTSPQSFIITLGSRTLGTLVSFLLVGS